MRRSRIKNDENCTVGTGALVVFVAMVLWVMLYTMSRYSKKLELRFNTENKN